MSGEDDKPRRRASVTLLDLADEARRAEIVTVTVTESSGGGMSQDTLIAIAVTLEADGVEAQELRALQVELDAISRPPGLITRLSKRARDVARTQWGHLVGELRESREAMGLIAARVRGERELTIEERDAIKAQMMDLVRVFPAGLIAAANSAFPVPGTSMFTPWLLNRLGLMPSRWREAHLLDRLRKQQETLRASGRVEAAEKIGELRDRIEHEAAEREAIRTECRILTHWDANENGVWDPEEREAYAAEVRRLRGLLPRFRAKKRWFLEHEGEVFGAYRLTEVDARRGANLLVCFDGKSGWVAVGDLLAEEEDART